MPLLHGRIQSRLPESLSFLFRTRVVERNFNFGVASGSCSFDGGCYATKMLSQNVPCGIPDNDNGDAKALQVLLVADALVGGQKNIEARFLGIGEKLTI
jgi:hypothetical protein